MIKPIYEAASMFSEGVARVKVGDKYGFVDASGRFAIKPHFEEVRLFRNDLAAAKANGKWGFLDKSGEWAIQPRFKKADDFEGKLALIGDGKDACWINRKGEIVWPLEKVTTAAGNK